MFRRLAAVLIYTAFFFYPPLPCCFASGAWRHVFFSGSSCSGASVDLSDVFVVLPCAADALACVEDLKNGFRRYLVLAIRDL